MTVMTYLEQLAMQTHQQVDQAALMARLPVAMQTAIRANDSAAFKAQLGDVTGLSDRSTIFQL